MDSTSQFGQISKMLMSTIELDSDSQSKLIATIVTILVFMVIRKLALKIVQKQTTDIRVLYRWRKTSSYIAYCLGFLAVGRIWLDGFDSISTYLGLLSAGIAISLKDPLVNLAGWAFILWRRPFSVGDRIQLGDIRGDVIDQRIFMFSLIEIGNWVDADQSTGRVIHVPNGHVFSASVANYSSGFQYIWDEIPVLLTFESNWREAKKKLGVIANTHAEHLSSLAENRLKKSAGKMMIFFNKLTPIVYTSVKDSGVMLTVRYLCEPRRRRSTQEAIWEEILDEFAKHDDIDFAYPTLRYYDNRGEGKPGARADAAG